MQDKPQTHDQYLNRLEPGQQAILQRLREMIKEILPDVTEVISYGLPAFKYQGKVLVGYGASANHCALYLFSSYILEQFNEKLSGFDYSKGTLRFKINSPLPSDLIQELIQAKIKEINNTSPK